MSAPSIADAIEKLKVLAAQHDNALECIERIADIVAETGGPADIRLVLEAGGYMERRKTVVAVKANLKTRVELVFDDASTATIVYVLDGTDKPWEVRVDGVAVERVGDPRSYVRRFDIDVWAVITAAL